LAREVFVQLLHEHGPLTNNELGELARAEGIYVHGWTVHPHMVKLEAAGRVTRVQLARNCTILWVPA
jgi:hypothetical protein